MKHPTLIHSSIIAAVIIAAAIGIGMNAGLPGSLQPGTGNPLSAVNMGSQPGSTMTAGQGTPYITLDPVSEKTTGDLLIVSGSTNLPEGTILMVQAGSDGIGYGGDTIVRGGTGGTNRFSAPVDTSGLKPGMVTITVIKMKGDVTRGDFAMDILNQTATFTLKGVFRGTDTPVHPEITAKDYIRIHSIGDRASGDQFLITGTTSLPVGTGVFWQIVQDKGSIPTSIDKTSAGIMANNMVTKGDGTSNRLSLAVDLGSLPPGEYIAIVSDMKGEVASGNVEMGSLTGSAEFTVK